MQGTCQTPFCDDLLAQLTAGSQVSGSYAQRMTLFRFASDEGDVTAFRRNDDKTSVRVWQEDGDPICNRGRHWPHPGFHRERQSDRAEGADADGVSFSVSAKGVEDGGERDAGEGRVEIEDRSAGEVGVSNVLRDEGNIA